MAQILPHLVTMIHGAPDGAVQGSASPPTILKWALWGCCAAAVAAMLVSVTRIVLGHGGKDASPRVFWTLIACFVAGSVSAIAGIAT
jgi:lipid-A-disaccharide synthase-like uncharacterized protein